MKGLLQKDICLLLRRKQMLLVFIAVGLIMGISTDGSFVVGYLTMLSGIIAVSTVSYDEYDNGMLFLMTLPVTPAMYVREKYLFCGLCGLVGCVFAWVLYLCIGVARESLGSTGEVITELVSFLPVLALALSVLLPLHFKFGAERSRTAMLLIVGAVCGLGLLVRKLFPGLLSAANGLPQLPDGVVIGILFAAATVAVLVSCRISRGIMEAKEY